MTHVKGAYIFRPIYSTTQTRGRLLKIESELSESIILLAFHKELLHCPTEHSVFTSVCPHVCLKAVVVLVLLPTYPADIGTCVRNQSNVAGAKAGE